METKEKETPLSVTDLQTFIDGSYSTFEPIWESGEKNEQMWIGNNYTNAARQNITNQKRKPISVPLAKTKIQRIEGIQRSQRTQFNITASQDPNDEIKAELTKLRVHAVERRSRYLEMESDLFVSGLAIKYSVSEMFLDYTQVYPRVAVKKIDYKDFMWDANSKEYDINEDALWCAKVEKEYRKLVEQNHGKLSTEDIDKINTGSIGNFQGRDKLSYYIKKSDNGQADYDIISLFNFYIKVPRKIYYVIFPDSEQLNGVTNVIESKHRKKEDAEERLRELQLPYLLQGLPLEGDVEVKTELCIDRYLFCYNKILEYEETDLKRFPFDVYFAVRFENLFCSFMDLLVDTQYWFDRFIMQIDNAMGKANKGAMQLNTNNTLAEGETPSSAVRKLNNGEVILTRTNDDVFKFIESKGANPQWLGMIDLLMMIGNEIGGGQQFNAKANAGDSGIKVNSLISQGNLYAKPFLDNLRRWKIGNGRNILDWLERYETAEDVIRVQGGALTPEMIELLTKNGIYAPSQFKKGEGYVTVNQDGNEDSYLKDSSYELDVSEEALSDNEKHQHFAVALEAEKVDPTLQASPSWGEYKLSLMDIPQDLRYKIIEERKEQMRKAEEQQQKMEQMAQQQMLKADERAKQEMDLKKAEIINKAPVGTFG